MLVKINRIVILFALIIPVFSISQITRGTSINFIDDEDKKQGKWVVNFENSQAIRYSGQFLDDKPIGTFLYYYPSGEESANMQFTDEKNSYAKMYHKNGFLIATGKYYERKKDSVWWYFNNHKEVIRKEYYERGIQTGEQITYYPSDPSKERMKIFEIQYYNNGVKHGKEEHFYESGRIKLQGNFLNGYQDGKIKYFFPSGNLEIEGNYDKGIRIGFWHFYNKEGEETKKVFYKRGKIISGKELEKHLKKQMLDKQQ